MVTYRLEPYEGGTRFTWEHTGFKGLGGLVVCKLLASVRKKMLRAGLPAALNDLDGRGRLHAGSAPTSAL